MRKDSSYTLRCFVIAILALSPFNGLAQMSEFLNTNITPELKPYDYTAEYDGLKGPVKEVIAFEGEIKSSFGNKTLEKEESVGRVKYLPNGLRMEAGEYSEYKVRYYFNNNRLDSILYHFDDGVNPRGKKTFEYVSQDSIVEKCYDKGYNGWKQSTQANIKFIPGGYICFYYPDKESEAEISSYINSGLNFNYRADHSLWANPILTNNSIFRYDRLSLLERQSKDYGIINVSGEINVDNFGRIIRIRPSQKDLNRLLNDGESYNATHIEYDENGNIIKVLDSYYSPGPILNRRWKHIGDKVIKIEYTYDEHGNWTLAKITEYNQSWDKTSTWYGKERDKEESYFIREISYYSENDTDLPAYWLGNEDNEKVFTAVEQDPTYPGGYSQLMNDIFNVLPEEYKYDGEGKYPVSVLVKFVVYKSGDISNVKVLSGPNLPDDVIKVLKQLRRFDPGKMNGKPVNVWFTLRIKLYLPQHR